MNVELIRRTYPCPMSARTTHSTSRGTYCVGGAFAMSLSDNYPFPTVRHLARLLEDHAGLGDEEALACAELIANLNDDEDFEGAWDVLQQALWTEGDS